jgi:hypothetical protein
VSEESHLEEMRSAIRGDFARLAKRRGDQELMRVSHDPVEGIAEQESVPSPVPDPDAPPRRSWLARFVSP